MVKIPTLQESQRLRAGNPTGFRSSSQARLQGELIAQTGRSISSLGGTLQKVEDSRSRATRQLARQQFKSAIEQDLQDIEVNLSQKGGSMQDNMDLYQRLSDEAIATNSAHFAEKFGSDFDEDFLAVGGQVSTAYRSKIIRGQLDAQKNQINKSINEATSAMSASVYNNPSGLDSNIAQYAETIAVQMDTFDASDSQIKSAIESGVRSLTDNAIEGYMNVGDYTSARGVILGDYRKFYSPEDQTKMLDRIRGRQIKDTQLRNAEFDRNLRMSDRNMELAQDAKAAELTVRMSEAEKSNDLATVAKVKYEAEQAYSKGSISKAGFGGVVSTADKTTQAIDNNNGYRIFEKLFKNPTPTNIQKLLREVNRKVENSQLSTETGAKLIKHLRTQLKASQSDPSRSNKFKAANARINEYFGTDDMIQKLEGMKGQKRAKRKSKAIFEYYNSVDVLGHEKALSHALEKNRWDTDEMPLFDNYGKVVKDEKGLEDFLIWVKTMKPNWDRTSDPMVEKALNYYKEAKDRFKSRQLLESSLESTRNIESNRKMEDAIEQVEDLFDLDELTKDQGDQIPWSSRR